MKDTLKNILKIIAKTLYYLFFAFVIIVAVLTIISSNKLIPGYKVFSVQSGSMHPAINTGDLILTKSQNDYTTGDIITFQDGVSNNKPIIITHRIIEVLSSSDSQSYKTKGDYNSVEDIDIIPKSAVVGKYIFKIPLVGFVITFARTIPGFIVLIVIPATIIIYDEFNKIKYVWKEEKQKKNN